MNTGTVIAIIFIIIFWIISGFLSMDLQSKKGYNGVFWLGFLLGIVGLVYSAGLPDISKKKTTKKSKEQDTEKTEELTEEQANKGKYILCPKCGFPIWEDEDQCSNCGYKKINK